MADDDKVERTEIWRGDLPGAEEEHRQPFFAGADGPLPITSDDAGAASHTGTEIVFDADKVEGRGEDHTGTETVADAGHRDDRPAATARETVLSDEAGAAGPADGEERTVIDDSLAASLLPPTQTTQMTQAAAVSTAGHRAPEVNSELATPPPEEPEVHDHTVIDVDLESLDLEEGSDLQDLDLAAPEGARPAGLGRPADAFDPSAGDYDYDDETKAAFDELPSARAARGLSEDDESDPPPVRDASVADFAGSAADFGTAQDSGGLTPEVMVDGPEMPETVGSNTAAVDVGYLEAIDSVTVDSDAMMPQGGADAGGEQAPGSLGMAFPAGDGGPGTKPSAPPPVRAELSLSAPAPEATDHWDDFDDGSFSGWDKSSGQIPAVGGGQGPAAGGGEADAPAGVPPQYARRDTDVHKGGAAEQQKDGARMVAVRGGDEGSEFSIAKRDYSIGRDPRCDIVLKEPSASREHATLHFAGDRFVLIDQKSGNGTFVNGQRVDRETLRSGDELAFGNGAYRFLEIGDVFKPVDASNAPVMAQPRRETSSLPASAKLLLLFGLLTVLGAGAVGFVAWQGYQQRKTSQTLWASYKKGVAYFNVSKWDGAEAAFFEMLEIAPKHKKALKFVTAIERERGAQQKLAEATRAHRDEDYARAYGKAAEVEAAESVFAAEARALMRRVNTQLEAQVAKARTDVAAGRTGKAIVALRVVIAAQPGRQDIARLLRRLELTGAAAPAVPVVEEPPPVGVTPEPSAAADTAAPPSTVPPASNSPTPAVTGSRANNPVNRSPSPARSSASKAAVKQVRSLFGSGKIEQAKKLLAGLPTTTEIRALRSAIGAFSNAHKEAIRFHSSKNIGSAIQKLRAAIALETKITGGGSWLSDQLRTQLANEHYSNARAALVVKRYVDSAASTKAALRLRSNHALTLRLVDKLDRVAADINAAGDRARKAGDLPQARSSWKKAKKIASAKSAAYKAASRNLASP